MSKSAGVSGYLAIGDAFYSKHVQLKVVHNPGRTAAPDRERHVSCVPDRLRISPSTGMTRKRIGETDRASLRGREFLVPPERIQREANTKHSPVPLVIMKQTATRFFASRTYGTPDIDQ